MSVRAVALVAFPLLVRDDCAAASYNLLWKPEIIIKQNINIKIQFRYGRGPVPLCPDPGFVAFVLKRIIFSNLHYVWTSVVWIRNGRVVYWCYLLFAWERMCLFSFYYILVLLLFRGFNIFLCTRSYNPVFGCEWWSNWIRTCMCNLVILDTHPIKTWSNFLRLIVCMYITTTYFKIRCKKI